MPPYELDFDLKVMYDPENPEHYEAVKDLWITIQSKLQEMYEKQGIGYSHGDIIIGAGDYPE